MKRYRRSLDACDDYFENRPHTIEWVSTLTIPDIQAISHIRNVERDDNFWRLVAQVHLPQAKSADLEISGFGYTAMHRTLLRPLKTAKMVLPECDVEIHPAFKVMATNDAAIRILHLCRISNLATVSRVFYRCFAGNNYFWYILYKDLTVVNPYNFKLEYMRKLQYEFPKALSIVPKLSIAINKEPLITFSPLQLMRAGGMLYALQKSQPIIKTAKNERVYVDQTLYLDGHLTKTVQHINLTHFAGFALSRCSVLIEMQYMICGQKCVDIAMHTMDGSVCHRKHIINEGDDDDNINFEDTIACSIDGIPFDFANDHIDYYDVKDGSYIIVVTKK